MIFELAHPELGEEVRSIAGHYVLDREQRLVHGSRQILYWVGYALVDSSCCGTTGLGFALVGGYLKERQTRRSAQGRPVSRVEQILPEDRDEVAALIRRKECVTQVNFWPACGRPGAGSPSPRASSLGRQW